MTDLPGIVKSDSAEMPAVSHTEVKVVSGPLDAASTKLDEVVDTTKLREATDAVKDAKLEDLVEPTDVTWNWLHRTGWKPYEAKQQKVIEKAYRGGETKVRLKSGKKGTTPMEIFFEDFIQYDPVTGNTRDVQRAGSDTCWATFSVKIERYGNAFRKWIETGKPPRESFKQYQQRRDEEQHHEEFDVTTLYWETGYMRDIAASQWFFSVSMLVVVFNAAWIAIDLDNTPADVISDAKVHFQIVEYSLCGFFTLELFIRFLAFKRKRDCLLDNWFVFDLVLVLLAIFELWIVPLALAIMNSNKTGPSMFRSFAALRMLRLMRLTKLFRAIPQLLTIVKGISAAVSSMLVTCLLLLILLFVFGVIFRSVFKKKPEMHERFGSVSQSAWTLLLFGTLLDAPGDLMSEIWDAEPMMSWVFLAFIFLSSFTVLNMLIGVLCEVVSEVSATEKLQAEQRFLRNNLTDILICYDKNEDGHIGKEEFDLLMKNLEVKELLTQFGTDIDGVKAFKEHMYADAEHPERLTFNELLTQINVLKGDSPSKVTDILELREYMRRRFDDLSLASGSTLLGETSCGATVASSIPWERVLEQLDQLRDERAADKRALNERLDKLEAAVHLITAKLEG